MTVASRRSRENWASAFKAIGLRALSSGKFWQFCFLCVLIAFSFNIKSADWVRIAELFASSYVYNCLGWGLWIITTLIAVIIHKDQRKRYLGEIQRLSDDRNQLQERLIGDNLQHSKYRPR